MNIFKKNPSISRAELEAYIGENAYNQFYSKALNNYMVNPNKINWNWPSFFIGIYWLLFRKTIAPAITLVLLNIFIINFMPLFVSSLLSLIILILLGLYGTNIYLFFAEKRIAQIKERNHFIGEAETLATLQIKGGTSLVYPIALYLIQFIIYNFL